MKTNFTKNKINLIKKTFNKFIEEYKLKKDDLIKEAESKISVKIKEDVLSHPGSDLSKILDNIKYNGNNIAIPEEIDHNKVDEYNYDDKGNIIKAKKSYLSFNYIYNDNNKLARETVLNEHGEVVDNIKYIYMTMKEIMYIKHLLNTIKQMLKCMI